MRAIVVALLGACGVLFLQMTTPLGAQLTDSLRKRSLGGLAAEISRAVRRQFLPPTSDAPASPQPTLPPAPVMVQEPEPHAGVVPTSSPAATAVDPLTQTTAPAAAVASPRSESRRRAPSAPTGHAQPRKDLQGGEEQQAVIPACSDSDPLCGISKRPH